jgi:hypothetical protein
MRDKEINPEHGEPTSASLNLSQCSTHNGIGLGDTLFIVGA